MKEEVRRPQDGIEVVELELELEDQVTASVSDDVAEEEEDVKCAVEEEACVVEDEIFYLGRR